MAAKTVREKIIERQDSPVKLLAQVQSELMMQK
jgi:hypothetical protein